MVTQYEMRQRARKIIKPNLQVLLVIALIAALPGLLMNVVLSRTGSDLVSYLYESNIDTSATVDQLATAITQFYSERGWIAPVLLLLESLIAPVLALGLLNALLTLLRGGTVVVTNVFSHMRYVVRATLLTLLIAVKMVLWALPGMLVMTLSILLPDSAVFVLAYLVGITLITALTIMAYYRYSLANVFQADEPELGVFACVRKRKAVMKNRKMQLFSLTLSYNLIRMLVITVVAELFGFVLGNVISMVAQLVLSVYISCAYCVFYETYARPARGVPQTIEIDPYHDEMKE